MAGLVADKDGNMVPAEEVDDRPAGNAGQDAWRNYRLAHGYTEEELGDKSRNELRDLADR